MLPGSVMFSPAAMATAASAQLPPLRRISRPQALAKGCVEETMPLAEWTVERREGKYEYWCSVEGKMDVEWRGIVVVCGAARWQTRWCLVFDTGR